MAVLFFVNRQTNNHCHLYVLPKNFIIMVLSSKDLNLTLSQKVASAGLAGCTADLLTFPLDTVKVWLQVDIFFVLLAILALVLKK